jgi:hypothetical protein
VEWTVTKDGAADLGHDGLSGLGFMVADLFGGYVPLGGGGAMEGSPIARG